MCSGTRPYRSYNWVPPNLDTYIEIQYLCGSLNLLLLSLVLNQQTRELISARKTSHFQIIYRDVSYNSKSLCVLLQQQRPDLPTVTLTRHASEYKAHKLHQRVTVGDSGLRCCVCEKESFER